MLLSAFTMVRNAQQLYYPLQESIESALPIVREFVVALGKSEDNTRTIVENIGDPRVKIYDRIWEEKDFFDGVIFAKETDFALSQCESTWCLYLQADEVLHEKDYHTILHYCQKYKDDLEVEGFLFQYRHFWGDYDHFIDTHAICRREIRIIRNHIGAYSYRDAVSFRKKSNEKLKVIEIPAYIYHYGYIRPPQLMVSKREVQDGIHEGKMVEFVETKKKFDWGYLGDYQIFEGTHPGVMQKRIFEMNWKKELNYQKKPILAKPLHKHERLKYRVLSSVENNLLYHRSIFGFKNYRLLWTKNFDARKLRAKWLG